MKKVILALVMSVGSVSFAAPKVSDACLEKASYRVISYLEEQEPKSDVHLLKDKNGRVIGLTDSEEIYPNFDLDSVNAYAGGRAMITFRDGDYLVYAELQIGAVKGPAICKVVRVDSGQDDQD